MRILSISDIHGELETFDILVEKLVKLTFDVVLIAGDMGGREESKTIIRELSIFGKPIFYVMGNWDCFPYDEVLHKEAVHIHLNHQQVGEWIFLGYSGCAVNGYKGHPTLDGSDVIYQSDHRHNKRNFGSYENYCKTLALRELSLYISVHQIDVDDLVFMTHNRFYSLPFSPLLYVFGHRHQPKYTTYKGVNFVNTSAVSMSSFLSSTPPDAPGNFCLIELAGLNCNVEFHMLPSP